MTNKSYTPIPVYAWILLYFVVLLLVTGIILSYDAPSKSPSPITTPHNLSVGSLKPVCTKAKPCTVEVQFNEKLVGGKWIN